MKKLPVVLVLLLSFGSPLPAVVRSSHAGMLQVMVEDENGAVVHGAHVYVYAASRNSLVAARDCRGAVQFNLEPAHYRVYSAATRSGTDYIDHYISPNAYIQVNAGDPAFVILRLSRLEDPLRNLSAADLMKMGLNPNLAKDLY